MHVGAFELVEPVPELHDPHMLITLRPWIDVGMVGTNALAALENHLGAQDLGQLDKPGAFYDFTRYRPTREPEKPRLTVPNTTMSYAHRPGANDLVFVHALEPHWKGETFSESLLSLAECLGVKRYCLLGAMYGRNPHTRPLRISGRTTESAVQPYFDTVGVQTSSYGGPTTILLLVTEHAGERGMGVMHLLVQLPPYVQVEEDYRGKETLLRTLEGLYVFGLDLQALAQAGERQYRRLHRAVQANPQVRALVRQLEEAYDSQGKEAPPLSDMWEFLQQLEEGEDAE